MYMSINAVIRHLFRGGVSLTPFRPFPPFPFPFLPPLSPLFPYLKVAPQIQLRDLEKCCQLPTAGQNDIDSSIGRKRGVFRAQGTCLVAANVVLFLLNEI